MSEPHHLLALDQGTTSTRAIVFDENGRAVGTAARELRQIFPADGWVEHDADEIWDAAVQVIKDALAGAGLGAADIAALGITNQRETTVLWDRATGAPLMNAIVWQDRRTADICARLKADGAEDMVRARTGLVLDPYFSGTKVAWILDNVAGARLAAEKGTLAFGTIDSFLLWRLTGGAVHGTDATNASRTLLFNIHDQDWDDDLLKLLNVPRSVLPEVRDSAGAFGQTDPALFGAAIPITGIAGDQQAAGVGQACFKPGMVKSTFGTGSFVLMNTGAVAVSSKNNLLTTVAYRLGGAPTYAIEGSVFVAGAAVQWLRDGLGVIAHASETEAHARSLDHTGGVYLVPAFTGLGAPHWRPDVRGALVGLTRDTGVAHIARAALEAVCYQTRDLIDAMAADGIAIDAVRVDGGMAANDWLMQFLADMLAVCVDRPAVIETTALGAAYLAGLGAGLFSSTDDIAVRWRRDRAFQAEMDGDTRAHLYRGWQDAVAKACHGGA